MVWCRSRNWWCFIAKYAQMARAAEPRLRCVLVGQRQVDSTTRRIEKHSVSLLSYQRNVSVQGERQRERRGSRDSDQVWWCADALYWNTVLCKSWWYQRTTMAVRGRWAKCSPRLFRPNSCNSTRCHRASKALHHRSKPASLGFHFTFPLPTTFFTLCWRRRSCRCFK